MRILFGVIGLIVSATEVKAFAPLQRVGVRAGSSAVKMASVIAETYTVEPIKSLDGTVTLPGSKSLSNRCLLLAALSEGSTNVDNLLESDDIRYMLDALDQMEVPVARHSAESVTVEGQNGPINSPLGDATCELFLGNAGTAMRPLAAALCMGKGKFVLDGVPRMRERPIADLIDGLQQLGADVTCVEETGCPPVTINANGLKGGKVCRKVPFSVNFSTVSYHSVHCV
jgi:3-phosphoshikimate 1-carboxyvinyltransferase